ncbi:MAG TPA: S8 family peptidase [Anaerolineales bacterium]
MDTAKNAKYRSKFIFSWVLILILVIPWGGKPGQVSAQASAGSLSYIVQGKEVSRLAGLVEKYGGTVTSRLEIIRGVGALLSPEAAASLKNEPGVIAVISNDRMEANGRPDPSSNMQVNGSSIPATDYPDVVGAQAVWKQGVNGANVTVAVVDTGLGWHPGLFKGVNGKPNGRIVGWKDFVEDQSHPVDPNGHGTHVAGVIANSQVGADGEWNGVAPGVSLVGVRVADEKGVATYERVIQGIQWIVDHQAELQIRVLNFSMSAAVQSPYWADPVNQALTAAWEKGIVVVTAAGNQGPKALSVGVPGNDPYLITVGAFTDAYTPSDWKDDYIPAFSSAGPTRDGFIKPDLVAPGGHIVSTMLPSSYLARNNPDNRVAGQYFTMAGTSQSAAAVSGIAARRGGRRRR